MKTLNLVAVLLLIQGCYGDAANHVLQAEKRQDVQQPSTTTTTTILTLMPETVVNSETQVLTETIEVINEQHETSIATVYYTTTRLHTDRSTYTDFNTIFRTPIPVTSTHVESTTTTTTAYDVEYTTSYVRIDEWPPEWLPELEGGYYKDYHGKHKGRYRKHKHHQYRKHKAHHSKDDDDNFNDDRHYEDDDCEEYDD